MPEGVDSTRKPAAPAFVTSADGTRIAYESLGCGPALVLLGGALNDRGSALSLANHLKTNFTVYRLDRRGRGDSTDTPPYSVDREIDDLKALLAEAGGSAFVYGHSSGAILGLLAAAAALPIVRLAIYEPPYAVDPAGVHDHIQMVETIEHLLDDGKAEEAVLFFMAKAGMPPDIIQQMRQAPSWSSLVANAPTLLYDLRLKAAHGNACVPIEALAAITIPVRAMVGGASADWMRAASEAVAKHLRSGEYVELRDQDHMVADEVVTPLIRDFFLCR